MERKMPFAEGEFYHVYNRGVEKRIIFLTDGDYARMELLLYLCNSKTAVNIRAYRERGFSYESLWSLDIDKPLVDIGAWCLMQNHFHLLVHESRAGGISQFMLKLTTAYSMYFNAKNERVGSLMQGPFKAEHVSSDRHLQYLFSYIHLNPVKRISGEDQWKEKGIKDMKRVRNFLNEYQHSSLSDYMKPRARPQAKIINPKPFPWKFESISRMSAELVEWLEISQKG